MSLISSPSSTPPSPPNRGKSDRSEPLHGGTLDSQGRLKINGVMGVWRIKLIHNGNVVTEQHLKKNPELLNEMAAIAIEALRNNNAMAKAAKTIEIFEEAADASKVVISNVDVAEKIEASKLTKEKYAEFFKKIGSKTDLTDLESPVSPVMRPSVVAPLPSQTTEIAGPTAEQIWKNPKVLRMLRENMDQHGNISEGLRKAAEEWLSVPRLNDPKGISGEFSISDKIAGPGNEGLHEVLKKIADKRGLSQPVIESAKKSGEGEALSIKELVLGYIKRDQNVIRIEKGGRQVQCFMRGEGIDLVTRLAPGGNRRFTPEDIRGMVTENVAESSVLDKKPTLQKSVHCTNFGLVFNEGEAGKKSICIGRSGKTQNIARIREMVFLECVATLNSSGLQGRGFSKRDDGIYEFNHAFTSFMDFSFVKMLAVKAKTGNNLEEDERHNLNMIAEAVKSWPKEGVIVELPDPDNPGKCIQVALKTQFFQQMFSSTLRFKERWRGSGRAESAMNNQPANQQLLERLGIKGTGQDEQIASILNQLDKSSNANDLERTDNLVAMYVLMTGSYPDTGVREHLSGQQVNAADIQIFRELLLKRLNIFHHVQCKSGVDRTAIGVALAAAQDRFHSERGTDFLPHRYEESELDAFRQLFFESLQQFGLPVTVLSKGKYGISWEHGKALGYEKCNTVASKYMPAGFFKEIGIESAKESHPYCDKNLYEYEMVPEAQRAIQANSLKANHKEAKKRAKNEKSLAREVAQLINGTETGIKLHDNLSLRSHWTSLGTPAIAMLSLLLEDCDGAISNLQEKLEGRGSSALKNYLMRKEMNHLVRKRDLLERTIGHLERLRLYYEKIKQDEENPVQVILG